MSAWTKICAASCLRKGLILVESNAKRLGHRGDVGIAGQLVIQYHAKVPCSGCRGDFNVLIGDK